MKQPLFAMTVLVGLASGVHAFTFDDVRLWAGSGPNRAGVVIDFYDGAAPRSFAWGFRWSGVATGEDLLRAVDTLDPALTCGVDTGSFGAYLDHVAYQGHHGDTWPAGYFSYWTAQERPENWTYALLGMSTRTLTSGDWDGWAFVVNKDGVKEAPPSEPVAAVPEPGTLIALALGWIALRRRR